VDKPTEQMASHDSEVLAEMLRSLDEKIEKLEKQRDVDSKLQSLQHGENKVILGRQSDNLVMLQRQMSSLLGEGQIDGRIGTMQREIVENRDDTRKLIAELRGETRALLAEIRAENIRSDANSSARMTALEDKFSRMGWQFLAIVLGWLAQIFFMLLKK
jgi:hypothetical protein